MSRSKTSPSLNRVTPSSPAPHESLNIIRETPDYYDTDLGIVIQFFDQYWRHLLVGALVVMAIVYSTHVFRETRDMSLKAAADALEQVHEDFTALSGLYLTKDRDEGKIKEASTKLDEAIKLLSDTKPPYDRISRIYRSLAVGLAGDSAPMIAALSEINIDGVLADTSSERILGELPLLALGRALLDTPESSNGVEVLKKLADRGQVTRVSAAQTLARVASTPEEKAEAVGILEKLVAEQPYQLNLLKSDLDRLKGGAE